jgi:hypothetical protein
MADDTNKNGTTEGEDENGFVLVSIYTRAEALEDGALRDVTAQAKEAGISIPTAVTEAVWNQYVELTPAAEKARNNVEGRLWDIVWMFRCAAVRNPNEREIEFELYVVTDRIQPSRVKLKAICGSGDDGEPVITLLLPDED